MNRLAVLCHVATDLYTGLLTRTHPCGLKTRKSTGTSCLIEIHFSIETTKFLMKCNLLCFQISGRLIISFTKHDYRVSTSFKLINGFPFGSYSPRPFTHGQIDVKQ